MTDLRTAAQQALWALEMLAQPTKTNSETPRYKAHKAAITALRAALAQQEQDTNPHQHAVDDWRLHGGPGETRSAQTPCDIAEDGVCEVIDCCRNSPLILEALEIGYDSAQAEAAQYHAAMAGYRPERHVEMDANVAKIAAAITAVKAALAQQEQEPVRAESVTTPPCKGMNCGAIDGRSHSLECHAEHSAAIAGGRFVPLPRREWQGLTEKEINDGRDQLPTEDLCGWSFRQGVYFAEKALKERNNG